ncbi:MAG: DUF2764 family protein [Rikenellaceae bacterium]
MISKQYYYLVASLAQYSMDSDTKGFDAREIREQICESLSQEDVALVRLMYTYYDIENIVSMLKNRAKFNSLGNYTKEELEQELSSKESLPQFITDVLEAYKDPENNDSEDVDTTLRIEKSLYGAFYTACAKSKNKFIRNYFEFDLNLRNVCSAYTAKRAGMEVSSEIVGDNFVSECLKRSTSSDFGLKGEVDYLDAVLAAVTNDEDLVQKEKQIDALRWSYSEDMVTFDYFSVDFVLCYLLKLNSLQRWKELKGDKAREVFKELLSKLVDTNIA